MTEQNTGWNLGRAALSWRQVVDTYMAQIGLTQSKWVAMMHLFRMGEGHTQSELASQIGIEQPSLIRTLNQLEACGFIERRESSKDARCKTLWFTEQGKQQLVEMQAIADEGRQQLLKGLNQEQRQLFNDILLHIHSNAQQMIHREKK